MIAVLAAAAGLIVVWVFVSVLSAGEPRPDLTPAPVRERFENERGSVSISELSDGSYLVAHRGGDQVLIRSELFEEPDRLDALDQARDEFDYIVDCLRGEQ